MSVPQLDIHRVTTGSFSMNCVLYFIGQMHVGVYGAKPLKADTLQPFMERSKLEHYGLGNVFLAFSEFTHHCEDTMDQYKYAYVIAAMSTPIRALFSSD
ncbi:hypothetical protein TNCV_2245121 [Trichonephila clavipes]|nr:hypothetical protein TNCV_2245121 [Trichonephila clavipes]